MKASGIFLGRSSLSRLAALLVALGFSVVLPDCIDMRSDKKLVDAGVPETAVPEAGAADIVVDLAIELVTVPPFAFGMHSSVYDNALHHTELRELLEEAGIALLRYPGGGYAEMYHWSTHEMTPGRDGNAGYLASGSDFGSYIGVVESFGGAMMITVNYGSNLQGDGPGEPKEAAAWVAYANGEPDDERVIGVDGSGNDWQTVGYWASLRVSEKLPEADDDGFNHLRVAHLEPLGIEYWEIGNEVFGNGWRENNMSPGFAFDLHVPYPGPEDDPEDEQFIRYGNELLSPATYGKGVTAYAEEMKAVDPSIKVGAVLGTPAVDFWATNPDPGQEEGWNDQVLTECATVVDFVIVHWYPNPQTAMGRSPIPALLGEPQSTIPGIASGLREALQAHAGDRAANVELVVTEVGPNEAPQSYLSARNEADRSQAGGLFAADTYLTLFEHGFINVDWLELHNRTFLNEARIYPTEEPHRKGYAFNGIHMAHLLAGPGDRLVKAESHTPELVVHASRRADGKVGVLLSNKTAPEGEPASVVVELVGAEVPSSGERYDYFAAPSLPLDGGAADASIYNGANGTVEGPTAFSRMQSPFVIEVPPYGVTLLVFDAPE